VGISRGVYNASPGTTTLSPNCYQHIATIIVKHFCILPWSYIFPHLGDDSGLDASH